MSVEFQHQAHLIRLMKYWFVDHLNQLLFNEESIKTIAVVITILLQ